MAGKHGRTPTTLAVVKNRKRNLEFAAYLREIAGSIEQGKVSSVSLYVRYVDGSVDQMRSPTDMPEREAGEMLSMALFRLGFRQKED